MTKEITALGEREILALAISLEQEDVRIYRDLAEKVRARFSGIASILDSMQGEESSHHDRLYDFYVRRFGQHIPYLRRYDIKGFVKRRPLWLQPAVTPPPGSELRAGDGGGNPALLPGCRESCHFGRRTDAAF